MTLEEKFKQQYEIGFPIFEKIFKLKKDDLIALMKDIFQDEPKSMELLGNNPIVTKKITDDEPVEVKISFYSSIIVNYFGISYKPEHGGSNMFLKFDKFLNVDSLNLN
jgi:hypothetical protein